MLLTWVFLGKPTIHHKMAIKVHTQKIYKSIILYTLRVTALTRAAQYTCVYTTDVNIHQRLYIQYFYLYATMFAFLCTCISALDPRRLEFLFLFILLLLYGWWSTTLPVSFPSAKPQRDIHAIYNIAAQVQCNSLERFYCTIHTFYISCHKLRIFFSMPH